MLRRRRSQVCVCRATFPDCVRQFFEVPGQLSGEEKFCHSTRVSRRFPAEKHRGVRSQRIAIAVLGQKSEQSQVIAQNPGATGRCAATLRHLRSGSPTLVNRRKNIQLDSRRDASDPLISIDRFEEKFG